MSDSTTRQPYSLTPEATTALVNATSSFVQKYMSQFDPSHDYAHIQRVVSLSKHLYASSPQKLDPVLVHLSALLHDVGDRKYLTGDEAASATPVQDILLRNSAPQGLAESVQRLVNNVSYTHEVKDPEGVRETLRVYPELGVVQDADRLDALGAVGVARCFAFGAAKRGERGLGGSVEHFGEKLLKLEGMLKTEEGRRLGRERTRRIAEFEGWWRDEVEGGVEKVERKWDVEDSYAGWENI